MDDLTEKLCDVDWEDDVGPTEHNTERLSICATSLTKPISFTPLFKRITWWNAALGAVGFTVTAVVGFARRFAYASAV